MNKKTIIFKIADFPLTSETFIVAQITCALNLGYDVKILVNKFITSNLGLYKDVFETHNLIDKIVEENYKIPKNKFIRLIQWFVLLVSNINSLTSIISFLKTQKGFSLSSLFQWVFYQEFNDKKNIFHVQYGTNKNPLDLLKSTGFYKPSLIVTFHGHDAFFPINGFIPNNGYYNNLFTYANLITANTPYLADQLLKINCPDEKLSIVPVGVDTTFFKPIEDRVFEKEKLKLITVGRLDPVKGHRYGIDIVKKLIKKGVPVEFTIVGEGEELKKLEEQIEILGLQNQVFLLGKKNQNEIRELFWNHDLYLLTAVALPDGRRETQGLATLEAQSCGLPVIAFDSGGVKYTIHEGVTGFVCEEYNVDEVVSRIEKLYNDTNLLKDMSLNTQKFINETYSLTFIESKWEVLYKNK